MQNLIERIQGLNDQRLIPFVGIVDEKLFQLDDANILYYIFPLIEKTTLEILKVHYYTDVEKISQGTYRTLYSMINQRRNKRYFRHDTLSMLNYYFRDSGLRNTIMHYSPKLDEVAINLDEINEIKHLSVQLLEKLHKLISKNRNVTFGKISYINND